MYVNSVCNSIFRLSSRSGYIDLEEQRIARRLMAYGVAPTGSKSIDRNRLHIIEREEAERLDHVIDKFLTISVSEQQEIQDAKNSKKLAENLNERDCDKGAKALGEQIYLAIRMRRNRAVG